MWGNGDEVNAMGNILRDDGFHLGKFGSYGSHVLASPSYAASFPFSPVGGGVAKRGDRNAHQKLAGDDTIIAVITLTPTHTTSMKKIAFGYGARSNLVNSCYWFHCRASLGQL